MAGDRDCRVTGVPPILVTGATGTTGTHLVRELLDAGAPVRVAARDPERALAELRSGLALAPDAELQAVRFDFADPSSATVFDGVERCFLLRPPAISDVKGVIAPMLDAAAERGVRHVVFLSIQGAERNVLAPHHRIEAALRARPLEWTFVRASYFMQNLSTTHAADVREHDEVFVPAGRRSRTAHVDARDVAAVAARALLEDGHAGRAYEPTGPAALTYDECAQAITAAVRRPVRYADPAVWTYWRRMRSRGMPAAMVGVTLGIYTAARLGMAARTTDDVERVTGRQPIAFEAFARDHAAAWAGA
ncbi:MAG TPA: NmrA family NAD(P)-binding protein [Candidatus Limnocylindrales bacterium]|nr:NmrA family NAD(P)-binding protein [Candidatus Limnocylindrales bacterium]